MFDPDSPNTTDPSAPSISEMDAMWAALDRPDPDGWSEDELTAHRHSLRIARLMNASIYEEAA